MQKLNIKKEILILLISIGLIGSILFCPINLESGKTCLFHKLSGSNAVHVHDQISALEHNHHKMLQYVLPFGLIWWFSIFLLTISFYYLKNSNQRRHYENKTI